MISIWIEEALAVIVWSIAITFAGCAVALLTMLACELYQEYLRR